VFLQKNVFTKMEPTIKLKTLFFLEVMFLFNSFRTS